MYREIACEADATTWLKNRPTVVTKTINLALQGGGSHGAFTWGVLDRLLEEKRIDIEGISATSAGAMNAAVLAYGFATGGRRSESRARRLLETRQPRGKDLAAAGELAGPRLRQSLAALFAGLRLVRSRDPAVLALRIQSIQSQSAQGCARGQR